MTAFSKTLAIALATAAVAGLTAVSGTAEARGGGKEVFIQEYKFAKPMHGYSGHSGSYYCDYQRVPVRKCGVNRSGNENCAIVGWTLRQMCQ